MLIRLYNSDKSKCLNVSRELFFQILSSEEEYESLNQALLIQFELEKFNDKEIIDVKVEGKSDYEKLCNLIRKKVN
jgi:hypothetical protein